jgi:hypothetical protein
MTNRNRGSAVRAATSVRNESDPSTLEKLREFLETARMKEKMGPHAFVQFEKELHEWMMEAEGDIVAAEMAWLDVDAPAVVTDGKVHRRVLRQSQTYVTSAGEVTLYKERRRGRVQDSHHVTPQADRHALEHPRRSGDSHAAWMGPERALRRSVGPGSCDVSRRGHRPCERHRPQAPI